MLLNWFRYEESRRLRVAIIHGMARMAAIMASTYKAYLGVGLGPLSVSILIVFNDRYAKNIIFVVCMTSNTQFSYLSFAVLDQV